MWGKWENTKQTDFFFFLKTFLAHLNFLSGGGGGGGGGGGDQKNTHKTVNLGKEGWGGGGGGKIQEQ